MVHIKYIQNEIVREVTMIRNNDIRKPLGNMISESNKENQLGSYCSDPYIEQDVFCP